MKRFNLDQFIWFCILMMISIILSIMFFTGKIFLLIDGKRIFSTSMMLIILYLLTIVQITKIFTVPSRGGVKKGYFQYLILIGILILVSNVDIPKTSLLMKGVKLSHLEHKHGEKHNHSKFDLLLNSKERIIVNHSNFHEAIEEITTHQDKFLGKEFEIEGIYYKDEKYLNSFIITQLNMNCCIADSDYLGILCEKDNLDNLNLQVGDKIKVIGTMSNFKEENKEIVKIKTLEIIKK